MNAVIALNPQEMQDASKTMLGWASAKLAAAEADLEQADQLHGQLLRAGVRADHAKALMNKAAKRVTFYEKVKVAIAAGYYVIPPFNNLQVFAVRTERKNPNADRGTTGAWRRNLQLAEGLDAGRGRWINPDPVREVVDTETRPNHDPKTGTHEVTILANTEFRDEIDLPVIAMKPQIIDAVGVAMRDKVFDALAIAPGVERNADPIIAGLIRRGRPRYGQPTYLTFLVAWWLDEADL